MGTGGHGRDAAVLDPVSQSFSDHDHRVGAGLAGRFDPGHE